MVCNKRFKYVCSGIDPEQLFDLQTDPMELNNLSGEPAYATTLSDMQTLVKQKWDLEKLNEDVRKSQNQRLFIRSVLGPKASFDWNFKPADQATEQCLRADKTYNAWAYNDVLGLQYPDASVDSDQ
jgi:choline-sulfatase